MKPFEFNDSLFEACDLKPFSEEELSLIMGGGDEYLFGPIEGNSYLPTASDATDERLE